MILFALLLALQTPAAEPEETALPGITVVAMPMEYRLRVHLTGTQEAADMVVSADPGMYCGDARFDRTPGPYRQCWLRGRRGEPILLTAQSAGQFGRDWTIDWAGCQPQGDGRTCEIPISGEMEIEANLRRL